MEIRRDDPKAKNFRSRHNCDNPGTKLRRLAIGLAINGEVAQG